VQKAINIKKDQDDDEVELHIDNIDLGLQSPEHEGGKSNSGRKTNQKTGERDDSDE